LRAFYSILAKIMELNITIVKKRATPLFQSGFAVVLGWFCIAGIKLWPHHPLGSEYFGAFIAIIFFTLINIVASIAYESYLRYTLPSYYLYIAMVAILFLSSKFLSGISIWDASQEEYRMMLIAISIFYLVASTLVRAVRAIYEAAEKGF
jgi:hypothetical protein